MLKPVLLSSNQPPNRFYRGGSQIAAFRAERGTGDRVPEDWIASTTTITGEDQLGLTVLPDGGRLIDEIIANPVGWLGEKHVDRFGADTKILVKLLDAGQRLPVHAHPDAAFAHAHLGRRHGKAEAWYILAAGEIYLGLTHDVSAADLRGLVENQDVESLLGLMHAVTVNEGDTVFVPPGLLHAIGRGVFLAEIQEPEDLSILLEWRDFELDGRANGHLGLGFDSALMAVDRRGASDDDIARLITSGLHGTSVLARASEEFFRIGRTHVDGALGLEQGFAVLIVIDGDLTLIAEDFGPMHIVRGSTVLMPFAAQRPQVVGRGELIELRPPVTSGHTARVTS